MRVLSAPATITITPPSASSFTTSFATDENPLGSNGANGLWQNGAANGVNWQNMRTLGGRVFAANFDVAAGEDHDAVARLQTSTFAATPNQYVEAHVYRASGYNPASATHELLLMLRMDTISSNHIAGYEAYLNIAGNFTIVQWNGPAGSYQGLLVANVSNPTPPANGDLLRFQIVGQTFSYYQNGNLIAQGNNGGGTYSSGQPGLGCNVINRNGTVLTSMGFEDWTCGNL